MTAGLTVVATGPLSNLARAVELDPTLADRVAGLVVMGGSARAGGQRPAGGRGQLRPRPDRGGLVAAAPGPGRRCSSGST